MNLFANDIITQECEQRGVSRDLVFSSRRGDGLPKIRAVIIERIHHECGLGPVAIGRLMNRDHTTICHHLNKAQKQNTSPSPSPQGKAKTTAAGTRHPDTQSGRRHPMPTASYSEAA